MSQTIKLYNTLTRSKEEFRPIDPACVRMYVCGPTVYDYAHIGNARPIIVFDVLFRLLRHVYGADHVRYVRNITDVDDKINARAAERGITIRELTEETNKVFQADVKALGCLEPTVQPRATEHIAEMIAIIEKLIAAGHAYAADDHVLFDTPSMTDYGRLSRRSLDEMMAGARVDVAPYKRGDMDFVLWKPSKAGEPGWESPWGFGRPGWHIECSAMSWKHLGETFDIHGGGIDLVFPHHENEIAQSRCAFHTDVMANVWMHNGFLQVEGEKMSKSLGNFVTIHELLHTEKFGGRSWSGAVLRLAMLRTQYSQPIDWTAKRLLDTAEELGDWCHAMDSWHADLLNSTTLDKASQHELLRDEWTPTPGLVEALADDLNTPAAITILRKYYSSGLRGDERSQLMLMRDCEFLGIAHRTTYLALAPEHQHLVGDAIPSETVISLRREIATATANTNIERVRRLEDALANEGWTVNVEPDGFVNIAATEGSSGREQKAVVDSLIAARNAARAAKNWAESDRIRDELSAMGIALKDNKDGTTTWEVKR